MPNIEARIGPREEQPIMTIWKIFCNERDYPGMWRRWFMNQCVAVGWKASWGFQLRGTTGGGQGWKQARRALDQIAQGDKIIVQLHNHRIARAGEVTGKAIEDNDWDPLVPRTKIEPEGEMGRRVFVRWDLTAGPSNMDLVVQVPEEKRFPPNELRRAICEVSSRNWRGFLHIMNDPGNWVGLTKTFAYERSLSEYIGVYPHRLEDGLLPHPSLRVRERVFGDGSRLDVLLIDSCGQGVVVECKQNAVTKEDIGQLRRYMLQYQTELGEPARGILVHGGPRNLTNDIRSEAGKDPNVELVQYRVDVEFSVCH